MASQITRSPNQAFAAEAPFQWHSEKWLAPRLVALTLFALIGSLLAEHVGLPNTVTLSLNVLAYAAGGFYGAKSALDSLLAGKIDVDLLMVLAALGAAFIDQWHEGAVLLFLFSLSNTLQDYAIGRSRRAISGLFAHYPETAKVKRGDRVTQVNISDIHIGDTILIEPGERIPVDGEVMTGDSAIDESPITGESIPVDKSAGDGVFAGTLNKHGILDVRATRAAENTTLSRIIKLVEDAQESQAPTQRFLERFEQIYAKLIIVGVLLIVIIPPALGLSDFQQNFYRAMVLMTVASPCALIISVPSAFISAIASAARGGILFKGSGGLEQLAGIKAVAFDKTGTLTYGQPRVTDVIAVAPYSEPDVILTAASAEARSEHPLAKAVVVYARAKSVQFAPPDEFEAIPGRGVLAKLGGSEIRVGRASRIQVGSAMPPALKWRQTQLEEQGKTVVAVLRDEQWLGLIAFADVSRVEARALVDQLKRRGIAVAVLTGDNARAAHSIARQTDVDRVYAELLPEEKAKAIEQLQREFGAVAMVGDGINDAPALAVADIGIAMGGVGADVALETADMVLMGDKLERLVDALCLSQRARQVVWQNIAFSIAVIALLVAGVFLVDLPLPLGVLGHEGSTVIVVLNGLISLLVLPELSRARAAMRS
ncbi:MAG: heavy metal translocating P-type ATPase [Chloroflexi bacterium]|nr:heavy metal translocating P-type ATPase [Chloroflexota bacterium]